ncbi:MAG: MFS transporter [Gemmatimonadetes bacterium]|nr:MFS transporter [Gemmatimonadota bacterium]
MLDAFDVMLLAMVLSSVISDLALTKAQAGLLGTATLLAAAAGGIGFGFFADRFGRTRALMASVLLYSVFTGMCGLAQNLWQFALCRVFLGIGMGGEWASGAALVSESWSARDRGKALGLMQSAWAVGYGAAAVVTAVVLPRFGWRAVFFVGVLPALLVFWVQRHVEEPPLWTERRAKRTAAGAGRAPATAATAVEATADAAPATRFRDLFRGSLGRVTIAVTLMNACTLFGWWGLNTWVPAYLSLPTAQGGIGVSTRVMSGLVLLMQVGMWFGYVTFGYIGDAAGRKRTYITYLLMASILLPLYGAMKDPLVLLALGPFVAFFGTGYFSGFGAITAELYPTSIRATAQGFTYNLGRVASAAAPFIVGSLAASRGFFAAFGVSGAAFLLAAVAWKWIPETKGRELA